MEPPKAQYPKRLFQQPDFNLLLKYFPEAEFKWPKNPDYHYLLNKLPRRKQIKRFLQKYKKLPKKKPIPWPPPNNPIKWVISVEMEHSIRQAFWDALRKPEASYLQAGARPQDELERIEKQIGMPPIKTDGTFNWIPCQEGFKSGKALNIEESYLSAEKDFSAELFAIHFFLKNQVKTRINPLRRFPVLSPDQVKRWNRSESEKEQIEELNRRIEEDIDNYISFFESGIKKGIYQGGEKAELQEKLDWLKELIPPKMLFSENAIRKDLCKALDKFLENENVCSNPEGRNILGAFLIFSSGLSFRNRRRDIWMEFDPELLKSIFRNNK